MTEEQFQHARQLRGVIRDHEEAIAVLNEVRNKLCLPQEVWERLLAERREFFESELARLEAEFAVL